MKQLLYKEFRLAIHPLFLLVSLLSALVLIPSWPYFIALMYLCFITVPNILTIGKASNDIGFSVSLPVRKRDVVAARFVTIIVLQLLQLLVAAVCAPLRNGLYPFPNALFDLTPSFFGFAFVMYALYNAIVLPMFYKTAYKIGIPVIIGTVAAVIFAAGAEMLVLMSPAAAAYLDNLHDPVSQLPVLIGGILVFALVNFAAYRLSARRFEKVDL